MRRIERTARFKRDYKQESRCSNKALLKTLLKEVLELLTDGQPLAERYRDHALSGEWRDHRDCHIKPDLILIYRIYRKSSENIIQLVRLGSHSELGL
ncbi:MAG: type II toxin-antitoxin system YafQ family toxin [Synechococcus sp. SB0678_bin_12]|nr:type II toxin-antitoxin system YafQ family toxin [Cyanobacteria bacterium MAG IRC4_bin_6]MYF36381.1 type II toxin-antitoxin system YafQ family toxin [Synechococcus sp. SB0678_bin_12]MYI88218.1 type II toxin-antitoxin system YafQ family toxin [Synechococcus sp. SB0672_bin_10]